MLLSDLLHSDVVDAAGERLGKVVDVRLAQDGPAVEGGDATLRVIGLLVGNRGIGTRLGYQRAGVKGPWLLRKVFATMERKAPYVDWSQVADWDVDASLVRLTVPRDELAPLTHA